MRLDRESEVHHALLRIVQRLDNLGVAYAIVGEMAMFLHGYRRFTEYVVILVTPDGLKTMHVQLEGRGHLPRSRISSCNSMPPLQMIRAEANCKRQMHCSSESTT